MRTVLLFLTIIPTLFLSCDKNGETLKNGNKVEIQKDGITYIDEQSLILPPGAYDGPRLLYTPQSTMGFENIVEKITLASSLHQKGTKNSNGFNISISVPLEEGVALNKKYDIKPKDQKEIFTVGVDGKITDIPNNSSIKYTEDHKTYFLGTGHIMFTFFDSSRGESNIKGEGTIEFTIPNENGGRSTFKGTFRIR
ncbi:hypothetical protein [Sphingobacterium thalpophilum]|uniref:hypothetical protein n=1 Tax=Sphingobacterium thalpophilum TaxID=259 RepID=UPI003C749BB4